MGVHIRDPASEPSLLYYSPSGKKIVYSGRDASNGDWEIYTINPGGGEKVKVADNSADDYYPSWGSS